MKLDSHNMNLTQWVDMKPDPTLKPTREFECPFSKV
jgi:hypothetical protein